MKQTFYAALASLLRFVAHGPLGLSETLNAGADWLDQRANEGSVRGAR